MKTFRNIKNHDRLIDYLDRFTPSQMEVMSKYDTVDNEFIKYMDKSRTIVIVHNYKSLDGKKCSYYTLIGARGAETVKHI